MLDRVWPLEGDEPMPLLRDLVDSGRLVPIDGTPEDVDLYRAAP